MAKIQSIRGMPDVLPDASAMRLWVEDRLKAVLARYGYAQVRMPIVEATALFARGVGDGTDIVEKEMYTFEDRSGEALTLRPEGTAGCVRLCEEHGLLYNQTQRLWYQGPMFRYERPQKGRYRQFEQLGVECFGFAGPAIDAELLGLCADFWTELGVREALTLELNTLGSPESRAAYRDALLAYLRPLADRLDEDSRRRLERNPLRILDSKDPETQALLTDAPDLATCLDETSRAHFDDLRRYLDALAIPHVVNPRIVRGLDYYTHTVFEWTTTALGAQGTVCGGGRYDGLVERLGGRPTPGIGFAMGLERLTLLVESLGRAPAEAAPLDVYVLSLDEAHSAEALALGQRLRQALPALAVQVHCSGGKAKARFKKADASGARYALILGEREIAEGTVAVKPLREVETGQTTWTLAALVDHWRGGLPSPSSTDVSTRR